jgi:hypothetical protein
MQRRAPSTAATAAGLDHVRLSYLYLDAGDLDGYLSLFDPDVVPRPPDARPIGCGRHLLDHVFGAGDRAAAIGRFILQDGEPLQFTDIFTIADTGLLVARDTYLLADPH